MKTFKIRDSIGNFLRIKADYTITSDDMVILMVHPEAYSTSPSDYAVATFYKPISVFNIDTEVTR